MVRDSSIAVLLSTYNGEKYLTEQLESLEAQRFRAFDLFIRDDGSSDRTREYIKQFQARSNLSIVLLESQENVGAIKSFELLLRRALEVKQYDYFMFCDQDDVWFSNKVEISFGAIEKLQQRYGKEQMLLVYTDLEVVDEHLHLLSKSFWRYFHLDPAKNCCSHIAMQCNVTGCTMIFNRALATAALPFAAECTMHDHWIALVASSFGVIDYVDDATIAYRQHQSNVSGGAPEFNFAYIITKALKYAKEGEFHEVLGRQIAQVEALIVRYEPLYTSHCFEVFHAMRQLREVSLFQRIRTIVQYRLFKHGWVRNVGLLLWLIKMSFGKRS